MDDSRFWKLFSFVTIIILIALAGMRIIWPGSMALSPFSFITVAVFSTILIMMYKRSKAAVISTDPYLFVRLMLVFFLLKFFLCLGLVALYWVLTIPSDKIAILPFFLIYLIYTTFEVYFLDKIAKQPSNPDGGRKQEN